MKKSKFTKVMSGLLCATMIFSSVSETMVSYAAEPVIPTAAAEQQTAEEVQQPIEGEQKPTEEVQQPTEGEQQPTEGEQQSAEDKQQSAEDKQQPAEGEQQPTEGEQQPTEGEQQPAEDEQQPAEDEQQPAEEETLLAEEAQQPVVDEQKVAEAEQRGYEYLTELPLTQSQVGHGSLKINSSESGEDIHLFVDGERTVFRKGIGAHAPSTVIYDISAYSNTLTHFVAYLGVDARVGGNGNGVKFTISVSDDGQAWTDIHQTEVLKGNQDAVHVDLEVTGKKFLKLYAHDNGSKGQDHSVYADARLKTASYDPDVENKAPFYRLKKYDEMLAQNTPEENLANHLDLIYEREFVKRIGFNTLQTLCEDPQNKEAIEFLKNNETAMHYFIDGGPLVKGNGAVPEKSMLAFSKLYAAHKDMLTNDFYLRLAISVASVYNYPENVRFWLGPNKEEDPVKRFDAFVKLSEPGGAMDDAGNSDKSKWPDSKWSGQQFRDLPIPLMRWVVDTRMNEDELFWLADYALGNRVREPEENFLNAYSYITYAHHKYDYNKPEYYADGNHKKWNDIYGFDNYFQYGGDTRRLWIVFQEGSVCGGLAKTYANLAEVFGRPSVVVGQPGHAATVTWEYDARSGKYMWKLQNDVYGWAQSHSEYNNYLLGWGTSQYAQDQPSPYTLMAADAVSDANYNNYIQANRRVMLANSYAGSSDKVDLYEKALQIQDFNLDAWEGLVTEKLKDSTMSSKDYLDLAKRIMDELKYYPRAMEDLLLAIKGKITEPQHIAQFDLFRLTALQEAEKATDHESTQPNVCVDLAKFLLNKNSTHLASFSFTGEHAGAIVLNEKYDNSQIQVRYSLDGGTKWIESGAHVIQLSDEQLNQLTAENDIKVGLVGVDTVYTIDLQNQKSPEQGTVYQNDQENLVFPENSYLEYSVDDGQTWQDYDLTLQSEQRFTGNQSVKLRFKRNGIYLASGETTYTFREDTNTAERTYLPLKHVSLVSFSSEEAAKDRNATHLIDGNGNTIWHSKYDVIDTKEYVVKFDQPYHITEVEYLPYTSNGRWKTVQIHTSMDGEHWTLVGEESLADNDRLKTISLDSSQPAQYLKVTGLDSWGSPADKYFSGKMLNFYVDTTKAPITPATVSYSITDKTNQNVTASITLPEGGRMLEGEATFTFEENGTHTFKYEDQHKNAYEVTAEVTWIRKADLTGTITYSTTAPTQDNVVAEIGGFAFEDVYVKNNNQSRTYTFTENGEFVFELADSYGNTGTVKAVVQNIERTQGGQTPTDPNHPQDGAKPNSGKTPTNPTHPQDGAKPNTGKNPATGDEMNLLFPVLGMAGSMAVLFVLLRRRKQHA